MLVEIIFWGVLGLILGSFANVLILRGGSGMGGRSACPHCHRGLSWFELFPVVSWIVLRGKCRTCCAPISLQYPIVELLMAVGTLGVGLAPLPLTLKLLGVAIVLLLLCIAVYDLYHTIIPDRWSYSFAALAGLWLFSRGTWMGLGDAKFALGIGWLLGIFPGYVALCLAFCTGALVGVFILLPLKHITAFGRERRITHFVFAHAAFTMKSEVPFAPFLIVGFMIVFFYDSNLFSYLGASMCIR